MAGVIPLAVTSTTSTASTRIFGVSIGAVLAPLRHGSCPCTNPGSHFLRRRTHFAVHFGLAGSLHASTIMPIRLEIVSILARKPRLSWSNVPAYHIASHSTRSLCTVKSVGSMRFSLTQRLIHKRGSPASPQRSP